MMDMLDPFLEIVLSGIRAKKEQQVSALHLNLEDTRALGRLLQTRSSDEITGKQRQRLPGRQRTKSSTIQIKERSAIL